jgi:hypothetical protein
MESLEARLEDATSAVDSKPEDAADRVSKDEASATRLPPPRHLLLWGIIAVVAAITLVAYGIEHRRDQQASVQERTQEQAVPTVSVITPQKGVASQELALPGDIQAWYETPSMLASAAT